MYVYKADTIFKAHCYVNAVLYEADIGPIANCRLEVSWDELVVTGLMFILQCRDGGAGTPWPAL